MIYVSKNQLNQVEYLIGQSIQGNHVLFDLQVLRDVFWKDYLSCVETISEEEAYEVEHHIERIISLPSLHQKRAYLEALDRRTLERVVKTYFNIVENNIYENIEVKH